MTGIVQASNDKLAAEGGCPSSKLVVNHRVNTGINIPIGDGIT